MKILNIEKLKEIDTDKVINILCNICDDIARIIGYTILLLGIFLVRCDVFGQTANIVLVTILGLVGIIMTFVITYDLFKKDKEEDNPKDN